MTRRSADIMYQIGGFEMDNDQICKGIVEGDIGILVAETNWKMVLGPRILLEVSNDDTPKMCEARSALPQRSFRYRMRLLQGLYIYPYMRSTGDSCAAMSANSCRRTFKGFENIIGRNERDKKKEGKKMKKRA
eukprot:gene13580-biopygen3679